MEANILNILTRDMKGVVIDAALDLRSDTTLKDFCKDIYMKKLESESERHYTNIIKENVLRKSLPLVAEFLAKHRFTFLSKLCLSSPIVNVIGKLCYDSGMSVVTKKPYGTLETIDRILSGKSDSVFWDVVEVSCTLFGHSWIAKLSKVLYTAISTE